MTEKIYITKFLNVFNEKDVQHWNMLYLLNVIKTGELLLRDVNGKACWLRDIVQFVRGFSGDKNRFQYYKEKLLPPICYHALFGSTWDLIHYNDIIAIDIDHIGGRDKLEAMRQKLIADPHSLAVFETVSGDGLKVLVRHDNTEPECHTDMYKQIMVHYDCYDNRCVDFKRRHFLSYDPKLWINPNEAVPYHYDKTASHVYLSIPTPKSDYRTKSMNGKCKSDKSMIAMLNAGWRDKHPEYWQEGQRACSIFSCACLMCKLGIDEELATSYFIDNWIESGLSENEIVHNCRGGYKYIRDHGEENTMEWGNRGC